jgi:hypothetical protein
MQWLEFLWKISFLVGVGAGSVVLCTVFLAYRRTNKRPFLLLTISGVLALLAIILDHTVRSSQLHGSDYVEYRTLRYMIFIGDLLIWAPGMIGLVRLCTMDETTKSDLRAPDWRNRLVKEIIGARASGVVHCGFSWKNFSSIADLGIEFDLLDKPETYREIDREKAKALVTLILKKDLAYDRQIMPEERATALVERFFSHFEDEGCRYYDNGMINDGLIGSWNRATEANFDTGVLIIGPKLSGCLWVEDED